MAKLQSYHARTDQSNLTHVSEMLAELPAFVSDYIKSRSTNTSTATQRGYVYDLRKFLLWWQASVPELQRKSLPELRVENLGKITARDIDDYILFLQTDPDGTNGKAAIARKLSAISSLYDHLLRYDDVPVNPFDKVLRPKQLKDKRIIRLSPDEVAAYLNAIEFGCPAFSSRQQAYLKKTAVRDLAIATLLLGTGIRVSECVGLDLPDVSFKDCRIQIFRKGGKVQYIPIGDEVAAALAAYTETRKAIPVAEERDEKALFLSTQRKRMCVQAVEGMITKYATAIGLEKRITPHKLRKTYGTELYNETRDIYLVANALGHSSVKTTTEHYVAENEDDLMAARNKVKLR